jgi:DNA-binding NarL/FixJ family response regulator
MPATANTQSTPLQADFTLRAKLAMVKQGLSVSAIARDLGLNRNTVSLAINRGLFTPTRQRVAQHLGISI